MNERLENSTNYSGVKAETQQVVSLDPELERELRRVREDEKKRSELQKRVNAERRFLIPILVFVALLFPNFGRAQVQGASMEPQYKEGDPLVVLKSFRLFSPIKPGDIVVIKMRKGKYAGEEWVKRVAFIQNAQGNAPYPEEVMTSRGPVPFRSLFGAYSLGLQQVPANGILVVGDNFGVSVDSRDPELGAIGEAEVVGKVLNR